MEGWISLHRQMMENELYFSEKFTKSAAWIDLLLLARHSSGTKFIHGIEIKMQPGDLCYSQLSLGERWKWNFKTVKKFLDLLTDRQMITYRGGKVTTIISIKNWGKYQKSGEQNHIDNKGESAVLGQARENRKENRTENKRETNNNGDNGDKKKRKFLNDLSIENLPLNLNGELFYKNDFFFINQSFKKELIENLTAFNLNEQILKSEFYKMDNWLKSNGAKKDYRTFIINWLSKERKQTNLPPEQITSKLKFIDPNQPGWM